MHRIVRLMVATALIVATVGLFGLVGSSAVHAQAPPICLSLEPGEYEIEVPELGGNPAGTLIATIGEGGELRTLVEPGGVDLVAIGAVHGLLPIYSDFLPEGVGIVDCGGDAAVLPSTGSGGIVTADGIDSLTVSLVLAISLGGSTLALLTLLAHRRRSLNR